ncbi:putative uncharacterized protein DDB_G0286901 [Mytilus trossulus]|uniref:putative uncharacterized protein DDB_G0286901 n=1 Tax=Mytilus trossulus TaxID=6551 RepID=UPI003004ECAB
MFLSIFLLLSFSISTRGIIINGMQCQCTCTDPDYPNQKISINGNLNEKTNNLDSIKISVKTTDASTRTPLITREAQQLSTKTQNRKEQLNAVITEPKSNTKSKTIDVVTATDKKNSTNEIKAPKLNNVWDVFGKKPKKKEKANTVVDKNVWSMFSAPPKNNNNNGNVPGNNQQFNNRQSTNYFDQNNNMGMQRNNMNGNNNQWQTQNRNNGNNYNHNNGNMNNNNQWRNGNTNNNQQWNPNNNNNNNQQQQWNPNNSNNNQQQWNPNNNNNQPWNQNNNNNNQPWKRKNNNQQWSGNNNIDNRPWNGNNNNNNQPWNRNNHNRRSRNDAITTMNPLDTAEALFGTSEVDPKILEILANPKKYNL